MLFYFFVLSQLRNILYSLETHISTIATLSPSHETTTYLEVVCTTAKIRSLRAIIFEGLPFRRCSRVFEEGKVYCVKRRWIFATSKLFLASLITSFISQFYYFYLVIHWNIKEKNESYCGINDRSIRT